MLRCESYAVQGYERDRAQFAATLQNVQRQAVEAMTQAAQFSAAARGAEASRAALEAVTESQTASTPQPQRPPDPVALTHINCSPADAGKAANLPVVSADSNAHCVLMRPDCL